jgi:hypothetical protein
MQDNLCHPYIIIHIYTHKICAIWTTRSAHSCSQMFHWQISKEQSLRQEAEINMGKTQTEWQMQESQWLVEHEEEVRALRQRNFHLSQMLQDTRAQYHDYIADREREV